MQSGVSSRSVQQQTVSFAQEKYISQQRLNTGCNQWCRTSNLLLNESLNKSLANIKSHLNKVLMGIELFRRLIF